MREGEWSRLQRVARSFLRKKRTASHDLDDFVQESFVRALGCLHRGKRTRIRTPYLFGICWRVACEHWRRERRSGAVRDHGVEVAGLDQLPFEHRTQTVRIRGYDYSRPAILDALRESVRQLPEHYRVAMSLRLEGLRMAQIADRLEVTLDVVRMRLYRARRMLEVAIMDRLEGEEDESRVFAAGR